MDVSTETFISRGIRTFIKTVLGNVLPVLWLTDIQYTVGFRFDGPEFWLIYMLASLVVGLLMWQDGKDMLDPSYRSVATVNTPKYALLVACYQPVICVILYVFFRINRS